MSYDLTLFQVPEGVSAESAYARLVQEDEREAVNLDQYLKRRLPEAARTRMQQTADELRLQWPNFVQFQPKQPLPWIELDDERIQVQVNVHERTVQIEMPYFGQHLLRWWPASRCASKSWRGWTGMLPTTHNLGEPSLQQVLTR